MSSSNKRKQKSQTNIFHSKEEFQEKKLPSRESKKSNSISFTKICCSSNAISVETKACLSEHSTLRSNKVVLPYGIIFYFDFVS